MKNVRFLILFLLLFDTGFGQYFRITNDTTLLLNSELVLRNSTKNKAGAFIKNKGNGITEFGYAVDSIRTSNDTIFFHRGDGWNSIKMSAGASYTDAQARAANANLYPSLSVGYVNPSWIASLPASKITGLPTGGGATSGTVAELRAMTTTTGNTYFSTDRGGGNWVDEGLNDGGAVDDGAIYIITANGHRLHRQITGTLDPKWWGADPTGATSSTTAINAAISYAKTIRNAQGSTFRGKNIQIGFSAGKYLNTGPINGAVGIDLVGTGKNDCALLWTNKHSGGIVLNETGVSPDLEFIYTNISGLSILGGSYLENPFAFKSPDSTYTGANGIELHNHRIKITDCSVEGWNETGITASSVYYIYVNRSFIKNNKLGYLIASVSTSNFLENSEVRLNGIGVRITANSFGNYISSNVIESNFSNFLPVETAAMSINAKGKAILLDGGANSNFIDKNYIENHYEAFALGVAANNQFTNNTIVPALANPVDGVSDIATYYGSYSPDNKFLNNTLLFYADTAKANIRILNAGVDYSTNLFTFNKTNFDSVISHNLVKFKGMFLGVEYLAPTIANEAKNLYYRNLQLDTLKIKINGVGKDAAGNITINTDNINEGSTNKFTQWQNIAGGIKYNGATGFGTTPITFHQIHPATNVNLSVEQGTNPAAVKLYGMTDVGGAAPMEYSASTHRFTGQVGIGGEPIVPFDAKFATDKHLGFYYDGTTPYLFSFNDAGLQIPLKFLASSYDFTNSPVSGLPATASTHFVIKSQLDAKADTAFYVKKTDSSTIHIGTHLVGAGTSVSPLDIDISKLRASGSLSFTGDGSTTDFTFVTTSIPLYTADSKVFITAATAIGSPIEWVEQSTESFIVHFSSAPSSGAKTLKYLIIP